MVTLGFVVCAVQKPSNQSDSGLVACAYNRRMTLVCGSSVALYNRTRAVEDQGNVACVWQHSLRVERMWYVATVSGECCVMS